MINIFNKDCMLALKEMKDNQFDLAIVDPPYGIGHDAKGMGHASNSARFKNYKGKKWKGGEWDKEPASKDYFKEIQRVSKNYFIWGANHFIERIPKANSPCWIVWYKNGQNPNSNNADCEMALGSFKTSVKYFRYDWSGFGAVNSGEVKIHPTQKPVKLYEFLLMKYAKEGDKILDTHLGSGSIAIACHNLGYDLEGYELDTEYYEAAKKRLKEHQSQTRMF